MSEVTRVPRLRFPEFRDEWQMKKIGEIFHVTRGDVLAAPLTKQEPDGEYQYPVYSSQTQHDGLMGYYNNYLFENCLTWTTDGANAGDVKYRPGKFYCTNVCGVLTDGGGYENVATAEALNKVSRKYVSYVGNPKLMNNVMASISITLPSVIEQRKIADFLTAVDEKIAAIKKKKELLEQYKKGVMQAIFAQRIRFRDPSGNPYPDWEEKEFGEVVARVGESSSPAEKTDLAVVELESLESETGRLIRLFSSLEQKSQKTKFRAGDTLFGKLRPYLKKFYFADFDGVCSSEIWVLRPKALENKYLYYVVQSRAFNSVVNIQSGSKMPRADWSAVRSMSLSVPVLEEQQKITHFLGALDQRIEVEAKKLEQAQQFKKALLQQMFV